MNTKSLAKHYDRLTPRERLLLIITAEDRGDETERDRLAQSAPQVAYWGPHHFGLSLALQFISNQHYMELADLAAGFIEAISVMNASNDDAEVKHRKIADDSSFDAPVFFGLFMDLPFMFGFAFKTLLAGWRLFCEKRQIPAHALWELLPGYERIRLAEDLVLPSRAYCGLEKRGHGLHS